MLANFISKFVYTFRACYHLFLSARILYSVTAHTANYSIL